MKRILDKDKDMGTTTTFHYSEHDNTFGIQTQQDVTDIIKDAKAQKNATDKHTRYGDGMTKVASIPMSMYHEWVRKGYTKDQKKMKQLLNSPELKHFRTREGKV